jgi:hypothetical protein
MLIKFLKNLGLVFAALLTVSSPSLALGPNDSLDPRLARIFFLGGKMGTSYSLNVQMPGGASFEVNGKVVGRIEKSDVLMLDLKPGKHLFSWKYDSDDAKRMPIERELRAGESLILQARFNTGGAGFGLFGLAASPAEYQLEVVTDTSVFAEKRFISSSSCPLELCPPKSLIGTEQGSSVPITTVTPSTPSSEEKADTKPIQSEGPPSISVERQDSQFELSKSKCREIGYQAGTEKFADCVMKLMK